MRISIKPALCALLLLSASSLHGQGVSRFRKTTDHYADSGPNISSLDAVRVQPAPSARNGPARATISIHDLNVPPKAAKELERAKKSFEAGDFHSAAHHLEKAIEIAPDFVQAHNNLGAAYIRLHEYENAIANLHEAIRLAPNLREPHHNLGIALLLLGRLPEAETAARRAVELGPLDSSVRYALGRILVAEEKNTPEAVQLLSQSAADIPDARLSLAHVLHGRGSLEQAIAELQTYLRIPDATNKEQVGAWLALWTKELAETLTPVSTQKP